MATAHNNDAQVTRSYHPNGLLQSETLKVREVAGAAFQHAYVTSYEYDANTRRKTILLPAALTEGANDRIRFTWEDWGALKTVTDPQNHTVTWTYDALGRPQTIQYPGALSQTLGYDKDDNVISDLVSNIGTDFPRYGSTTLRNVAFQYDGRGKVLRSTETGGFQESTTAAYSGLGYLTNFTMSQSGSILILAGTVPQASYSTAEGYTPDGLGNITARTRSSTLIANGQSLDAGSGNGIVTLQAQTGRLLFESMSGVPRNYVYDAAGNTTFFSSVPADGPWQERRSLYGPDGQLRFADWRFARNLVDFWKSTFEEYRYDALGRRVLVRSQRVCGGGGVPSPQGAEFAECKAGFVRRTIWDGAQELGEIQVPDNAAFFEADSFTTPLSKSDATEDPNPYYGRVIYTPGLVIDQPVTITRLDYTDFPFGATEATRWPLFEERGKRSEK